MKKFILSLLFVTACFAAIGASSGDKADVAYAGDFYDMINDKHIELYENEIAGEKVVSQLNKEMLAKMAQNYGVPVEKMKTALVFKHALNSAGVDITLEKAASLTPGEIYSYGKVYVKYLKTVKSEDELKVLAEKFKELSKQK